MPLITLNAVDYSVGGPLLLEKVELAIEPGERIALIGRNGAGKSTLMRLLSGEIRPDDGDIRRDGTVRVSRLEQEVPAGAEGSVFDVVAEGLGSVGADLAEYHHLAHAAEVGRVVVVDETRHQGGAGEAVVTALVEGGFSGPIRRVAARDSFVPLGDAANLVLVGEDDIAGAARALAGDDG